MTDQALASCPSCGAKILLHWNPEDNATLLGACPAHGTFVFPLPQRRRTDAAHDADVIDREELTEAEKFVRRVFLAHRTRWGAFLLGLGATIAPFLAIYPKPWLMAVAGALTAAGTGLVGAGSSKPDQYHRVKNEVLKQHGKM